MGDVQSDVQANYPADVMKKLVALCKRRGFVFQSSEIYGGLKSAYDYGPFGVELKRNVMNEWWADMVHTRENVVGIDALDHHEARCLARFWPCGWFRRPAG